MRERHLHRFVEGEETDLAVGHHRSQLCARLTEECAGDVAAAVAYYARGLNAGPTDSNEKNAPVKGTYQWREHQTSA